MTAEKDNSKSHQKPGFKTKFGEVNGINNGKKLLLNSCI